MRMLIDGYNLAMAKGTGVATYARNLSREATRLGHEVSVLYGERFSDRAEPLLREIAFFDAGETKSSAAGRALRAAGQAVSGPLGHRPRRLDLSGSVIARSFDARLPECAAFYNGSDLYRASHASFALWGDLPHVRMPEPHDLAHWTYPLPVRAAGCANIYTMHDLVPLRLPHTTLDHKRRYLRLMRRIARTAEHIVTVSECSRRDIVTLLGVPEERVTNTYQSIHLPERFTRLDEAGVAREVEGLAGVGFRDYFLFWGSIEPKKNIGRMIEAYLASNTRTPLVIVGARAWKSKEELALLDSGSSGVMQSLGGAGRARDRIIQLSYVPFGLLVSLIRGAKAALFPSLYEGFGLPALEAMLLGTPVLCSNTASLPEVVGDAALSVDPYDVPALAAAILRLEADADLRAELARRGPERAALFSPDAYRQRLHDLYEQIR